MRSLVAIGGIDIALVGVGLALLVGGGEVLVRGAVALAARVGVRPAIIGLTVVAAGTSAPELTVSLLAAARGSSDLAVANVVGSNLFNIGLILGVSALIQPLVVHVAAVKRELPVLIGVTVLALAFARDGTVGRLEGAVLLACLAAFTLWLLREARATLPEEADDASAEILPGTGAVGSLGAALAWVLAGLGLMALGAHALVEGAIEMARAIGWSERIIGLTIVAAGTSLPELAASLVAARRGQPDIALGNVLGSNLFNLAGILGFVSVVVPQRVAPEVIAVDGWWMLGLTAGLLPALFTGWRLSRAEGALLLAAYAVYLALLLT